jgi:integrase
LPHQRPPFEISFTQDRILAPGVFDDLNPEARRVIYVMVETRLRPSEIVNLTPNQFVAEKADNLCASRYGVWHPY